MKGPILFFLLIAYNLQAQFVTGKVLDAENRQPLFSVNIGVLNKIWYVSNEYGDLLY